MKSIWILTSPDNGHWNEEYALEVLGWCAERAGVSLDFTGRTCDAGFGQEKEIVVQGEESDIEFFELCLNAALY